MTDNYSLKLILTRLTFLLLMTICGLLYKFNLTDYIILVSILILFFGLLITISRVDLTSVEIKIKKNYFWGLITFKRNLLFDQVVSIRTKEYEIETHEGAWMLTESIFSFLTFEFLKPKVYWLTTKLSYLDNGIERNIELKISKDDFKDIERRIKSNDIYQSIGKGRGLKNTAPNKS
jgi:hypothetical protein